jgi:hypothetical protein
MSILIIYCAVFQLFFSAHCVDYDGYTPSHKFVRIGVSAELEESKNTACELIRAVLRATGDKSVQLAPRKIAGRLHAP